MQGLLHIGETMASENLRADASLVSTTLSEDLEQQAEHSLTWLGDAFRMVTRMQEDMAATLSGIEVLADVKDREEAKHGHDLGRWESSKPTASVDQYLAICSSSRASSPQSCCGKPHVYAKLLMNVAEHRQKLLERATQVSQVLF
jgi:hypothetical protein